MSGPPCARQGERVCCLLVLNSVTSTLQLIRQLKPRDGGHDVCVFVCKCVLGSSWASRATWPNGEWRCSTRRHMLGPCAQRRCQPTGRCTYRPSAPSSLLIKLQSLSLPPCLEGGLGFSEGGDRSLRKKHVPLFFLKELDHVPPFFLREVLL